MLIEGQNSSLILARLIFLSKYPDYTILQTQSLIPSTLYQSQETVEDRNPVIQRRKSAEFSSLLEDEELLLRRIKYDRK